MPGFTSTEIQAAVDKFLLGNVSVPITSLGARDVMAARDDIYALLTTTLLLRPDSYFYVIFLAKNRLEALRRQQVDALNFILDPSNVAALNRRGKPVTSTTDLTNARASLLNMNAGLNQSGGNQTRNLGPEVSRFRASVESFVVDQLKPNVVEGSTVTETAGELRAKIGTVWKEVVVRHNDILTLSAAISDAITNLNAAKLPQSAVQAVVSRMENRLDELTTALATDKTLETHRESMLELLTMRTLLGRVSSFRTPQEVLAPLTGDSGQVSPVGGTVAGSLEGTISGPFNVPPAATLDFETGTPIVSSTIVMPRYSNAEVSSADLAYPLTFPVNADLRLRVDGVLYPSLSYSGSVYASALLFLASINAYLVLHSIPATASIVGASIHIRSNAATDVSSVSVLETTANESLFLSVTGFARNAVCNPVTVDEIVSAAGPWPNVRLAEAKTEYGNYAGRTAAASVIDLSKSSGTVATTGSETLTFTVNLESMDVRALDTLVVIDGLRHYVRTILSVAGGIITLDDPIPNVGTKPYRIGPDFTSLPVGTRALVSSNSVPLNSGPYRVVLGDVAQITVDRTFFVNADPVGVVLQTSFLVASATGATAVDGITANPASAGATAVGYTVTPTQTRAGLTHFEAVGTVDFLARGVGVGDQITLQTSPAAVVAIELVGLSNLTTEPVPFFSGPVEYVIRSARYLAWLSLVQSVDSFVKNADFAAADFAITRILSGAASTVLLGGGGPVGLYAAAVAALSSIQDYVVPFERTIDNILRMLTEQGMDRAADLFTSLQVEEFFGMHPDGVSYSSNLIRTAADVTRNVAPVSRNARSIMVSPEVVIRYRRRTTG